MAFQGPRTPIPMGPFPLGQDNRHEDRADQVFQMRPAASEGPLPRLMTAHNVDIKDDGYWRSRTGLVRELDLESCIGGFTGLGMLFVVYDGKIGIVDTDAYPWTVEDIVVGISPTARVACLEFASQVWWTNGEVCGRIDADGNPHNWGAEATAGPTLSQTTGDLPAGRYHVAMTVTDASGAEHGASDGEIITLPSAAGITVTPSAALDSNAVTANIYISGTDQDALVWAKSVAVGDLPTSVTSLASEVRGSTRPLRTMGMRGPIPADGLFSFLGAIYLWRGKEMFRSNGTWHHIFMPKQHVTLLPASILGGVGLEAGFWVVVENGAWWFSSQEGLEAMRPYRKCYRNYAKGAIMVDGSDIPAIGYNGRVMLAVSDEGLMVGLPTGELRPLTDSRLDVDVENKQAHIAVTKRSDLKQIVFTMTDAS